MCPPPSTFCQVFSALNFSASKQVFQLGYTVRSESPFKIAAHKKSPRQESPTEVMSTDSKTSSGCLPGRFRCLREVAL